MWIAHPNLYTATRVSAISFCSNSHLSKGDFMRPYIRLGSVMIVAAAMFTVAPPAAQADPFPAPGNFLADNSVQSYCLWSDFVTAPEIAHGSMQQLDDTSDLVASLNPPCIGEVVTDVQWTEENMPGFLALYQCQRVIDGVCTHGFLWMNYDAIDGHPDPALIHHQRLSTGIHEVGHSVGLGHTDPSTGANAMRVGEWVDNQQAWLHYTAHQVQHLNDAY